MSDTKPEQKTARRSSPRPHARTLPSSQGPSQAQLISEAGQATAENVETRRTDTAASAGSTAIRIARPLPKPQPRALSMFESELLEAWATS